MPGRTGKQCRERYLNHLAPNVKHSEWSLVEDAVLFELHHVNGSKWSYMSKMLHGRSDNGIKNRYHHLKRRVERQLQLMSRTDTMKSFAAKIKQKAEGMEPYDDWLVDYIASVFCSSTWGKDFGEATNDLRTAHSEVCVRCHMVVPSEQTGRLICKSNGWCEACSRISPCVPSSLLALARSIESDVHTSS